MISKLICPDCNKIIKRRGSSFLCSSCKRSFKSIEGVPIILPKKLSKFKKIEKAFYEKEFKKQKEQKGGFDFVESNWENDTFGLLDFMDIFDTFPKDSKILEIGSGNAQYSLILKKRGFENVLASDISPNGLIAAKNYIKKSKDSFIVFDAENIPFESDTFDIVFLTAALHHLPHPEKGIAEMRRCTKKGGMIIVAIEPNSWFYYMLRPIAKLLRIRKINKSKDSFSIGDELTHGFLMSTLKKYFKDNKIKIVKTQRVWYLTGIIYYLPEVIKRVFNLNIHINPKIRMTTLWIDKLIAKIPLINAFSFHNTIVGEKK